MDWLVEVFASEVSRRALLIGLIVAVTTAVVGTWIVLRGMTFLGDALAHGIAPGLVLASVTGVSLGVGAGAAALVMVGGIELVHRRAPLREDVGIGLLFVGMLALGVIVAGDAHAEELTTVLFGDVLEATGGDVAAAAATAVVAVTVSVLLYRPLVALAFDRDKAASLGLRPGVTHVALLVLLAGAVVTSYRAVGVLLVFGFLVGPPATAALVARRVPTLMGVATGFGASAVVTGLVLSHHVGTPPSASMAGLAVVQFFVVLVARDLRALLGRGGHAGDTTAPAAREAAP